MEESNELLKQSLGALCKIKVFKPLNGCCGGGIVVSAGASNLLKRSEFESCSSA